MFHWTKTEGIELQAICLLDDVAEILNYFTAFADFTEQS